MKVKPVLADYLVHNPKILFVAHLALGDFTYLQPYFKKLAEEYPTLTIDLWIDEVRRTYLFWRWKYLKNYILYDWVASCSFFNKLYTKTYSWGLFKQSMRHAQAENYPIVISLATLRSRNYAQWARDISPNGFVVGIKSKRGNPYPMLDCELPFSLPGGAKPFEWHVSDLFAFQFKMLFGIELTPKEKFPFISIPDEWKGYGKKQLEEWGIATKGPLLFINPFGKDKKRCWDVEKIPSLLDRLKNDAHYKGARFIINAPPEHYDSLAALLLPRYEGEVFLLRASDNFFQLPSMMSCCDLIVSVETSIMHFAVALNKPLVPLMRKKTPEWIPLGYDPAKIVFTDERSQWMASISVDAVFDAIKHTSF